MEIEVGQEILPDGFADQLRFADDLLLFILEQRPAKRQGEDDSQGETNRRDHGNVRLLSGARSESFDELAFF